MSAFICSDLHIFTIAEFIAERMASDSSRIEPKQLAQDIANKMKRVNIESVNFRYAHHGKTRVTKCKPLPVTIKSPLSVLRLLECWVYQSCEQPQNVDFLALSTFLDVQFSEAEHQNPNKPEFWAI